MLAELARRKLVPEIWLPGPHVRAERERARFRLHLVKHRSSLKNRVHAILFQHGLPTPHRDLFGAGGRCLLARLQLPEPWASTVRASLALIDRLDEQIDACERELRRLGVDHRYIPLLTTLPGVAWVLGYTIAAEIGDIARFPESAQADRLHRAHAESRAVRRARPPRAAAQERAQPHTAGRNPYRRRMTAHEGIALPEQPPPTDHCTTTVP